MSIKIVKYKYENINLFWDLLHLIVIKWIVLL